MRGLKIDTNFFLKILNDEWLVDPKHKTLEDKEVAKISEHQGLSVHEKWIYLRYEKNRLSDNHEIA